MQFGYKTLVIREKGLLVTKFDLKQVDDALEENGKEGWELVSSFATDLGNNDKKDVVLIFKRVKDEFV